ncbi:MAG: hypothetical protein IPL67_10600 [Ignavibacteria bacterium]|nr:hypothetical protein [Ignavibacteria bacterium]
MAELCLLQRASIHSFSSEVTKVSDMLLQSERNREELRRTTEEIYKHYIFFINRIYFREVTAQEQGIEIFDKMQSVMRLHEEAKDLEAELDELHKISVLSEERGQSWQAHFLTMIATVLNNSCTSN